MIRSRNTIKVFVLSFFAVITAVPAHAEYRAFLHEVTSTQPLGDSIKYAVTSTLDRIGYQRFYGGQGGRITVKAVKSWMCTGHTGYRSDICPDPDGRKYPRGPFPIEEINRQPAAEE